MNDPELDGAIDEAAQEVEHSPYGHEEKEEEKEEEDFLDPSRWWFASTAFPLIAGTFGPMANAFSICALVQNWREYIPPGSSESDGQNIKDPAWVLVVNSISLVCALAANIALLLNMARRISFTVAQSITIVGWLVASFLLIALVIFASGSAFRIEPKEEHALTQAYYYAIIAAAIYCIISMLLVFTVVGAYRGHFEKEFRLTVPQRTLMLQTIGFLTYLLLGALVFSKVEDWKYLDALYWADLTCLTIGLGSDFSPKTHLGRSLLFPFAIGGILMIGLVVGSVRSLVLERGKHKMEARFTEKKRERVVSSMDPYKRTIKFGMFNTIEFSQRGLTETQRRRQEFEIMRRIQKKAERIRRWTALALSIAPAALLWCLGALVFEIAERPQGWSYFQALYFSYVSLLTIGYGDYTPASNSAKAFFVVWTLLAVPTLTILISNMGDTVIKTFSEFTIWVGSWTVLPGEHGAKATLKTAAAKLNRGRLFQELREGGVPFDKPPGILPLGRDNEKGKNKLDDVVMDRIADLVEKDELREAEEAGEHGDFRERDIHFYHFILAKELRAVMKDVEASPPKQYTYDEWAYFLKLFGQDEADPSHHRRPHVEPEGPGGEEIALAGAAKDGNDGEPLKWSWLGSRSPLMGNKTEAEWILERLALTLEKELEGMRSSNEKKRNRKPPISFTDLRESKLNGKKNPPSVNGSDR